MINEIKYIILSFLFSVLFSIYKSLLFYRFNIKKIIYDSKYMIVLFLIIWPIIYLFKFLLQ